MRILSSALLYGGKIKNFVQPVLSSNGTIGGNSFAVCASRKGMNNTSYAYRMFDNKTSTNILTEDTLGIFIHAGMYNPKPLNITSATINFTKCSGFSITSPSIAYNFYGTNNQTDFINYFSNSSVEGFDVLTTGTLKPPYNAGSSAEFSLELPTNTKYYKFHIFSANLSYESGAFMGFAIAEIKLNGLERG